MNRMTINQFIAAFGGPKNFDQILVKDKNDNYIVVSGNTVFDSVEMVNFDTPDLVFTV